MDVTLNRRNLLRAGGAAAIGLSGLGAASRALAADDAKTNAADAADPGADGDGLVSIFNGTDLTGWRPRPHKHNKSRWTVGLPRLAADDPREFIVDDSEPGEGALVNSGPHGVDLFTEEIYGDVLIEIEVMVPAGSNSGIFVMGEYEVQLLDSRGREENPGLGDMGALYGAAIPWQPLYKSPGRWQTFRIAFRAPRIDDTGRKTSNALFERVELNGRLIHRNIEVQSPTRGGLSGKEAAKGSLMLQGDHGPVAFRNIRIGPLPQ